MSTGNSSKFGRFLGIITTFLIIETIPQQILATEVNQNNHKQKDYKSVLASSDVVGATITQNHSLELATVILNINHKNGDQSNFVNSIAQKNGISYQANDLQLESASTVDEAMTEQLLAREVDLETFCRRFPLNSRCVGYKPTSQRQRQQQELIAKLNRRSSGFAVTGKVSTLGIGIEGIGAISPNFNGRLGFNYFDLGIDVEESDINYDADVQLLSASALIDWFPSSRSEFRVSGGLFYNDNRVDATARSTDTLEIGGVEFPLAAVGQLEGEATFPNTISPYIGIGYGNPVKKGRKFGFSIDLGVMFTGSPEVDLNATGPVVNQLLGVPAVSSLLEEAIQREEDDLEDDLSGLSVYPILSIGVSYQF